MPEQILFLTGKLAERQLRRVLEEMSPDFDYQVHVMGLSVAALMTADMIRRRLKDAMGADRILVPGRCRGDLDALSEELGIRVERGPDELHDLPEFFGRHRQKPDLSLRDLHIFAEIVDAPQLSLEAILGKALRYQEDGADVIDLGCLPETPFPHLEETIVMLRQNGFLVSVDSLETADLLRGGRAGADFILSLSEETLWIADEVSSTPILIPARPGDLGSLDRAIERFASSGREFVADPILDPIHFGFTDSLVRYHALRARHPNIEIMMGVGNLTELTHADTAGMNALLLGICSELGIRQILATQVSPHACSAIREADLARRIMYAARESGRLPKAIDDGLMALHERKPFPLSSTEIRDLQAAVRDPSYRILVSAEGLHVFNRDGLLQGAEPFSFFPNLGVEHDGGHAFYLGVELARAEIAFRLGKRYTQDQPLQWGCGVKQEGSSKVDSHAYQPSGTTRKRPKPQAIQERLDEETDP